MTMAQTGCTVSIVASMLVHAGYNTDPGRLNTLLTNNQGYAQGNLVIWTAIEKLFPKVKFVYRYYNYRNDLAREWIDSGKMPIIEVGAAPIGGAPGGKHWVGFVGDKKSVDPWTGTIKDTSTWSPVGMALYEYLPKGTNMSLNDEIIGKASQRDKVVANYKLNIGTADDSSLLDKVVEIETASYRRGLADGRASAPAATPSSVPPKNLKVTNEDSTVSKHLRTGLTYSEGKLTGSYKEIE